MSRKNQFKQYTNQMEKVLGKRETVASLIKPIEALEVLDPETNLLVQTTSEELKKSYYKCLATAQNSDTTVNVMYQVVFPDDLNLKPVQNSQKSKKGRPKKPKIQVESPPSSQKTKIKVVSKTRSGREVKFPKYIENEFKKIEINDDLPPDSTDVKISDFVKYTETDNKNKVEPQNKLLDETDLLQKKRRIAAQYRCPKCKKAYLGRNKILEHLRKNPSHGPMHQNEETNFEVWNYLVNVTQKCPSSERGQKFCQELSNLLHNLLLLTNALFKKLGSAANEVKIDKVLGNAIGLSPGNYYFDDNNLNKNVTVLKLMANNDFLHSIKSKTDEINLKSTILSSANCNCGKRTGIGELFLKSMLICPETDATIVKQEKSNTTSEQTVSFNDTGENSKNISQINEINKFTGDALFASAINSQPNFASMSNYEIKSNLECEDDKIQAASKNKNCKEQNTVSKVNNVEHFNGKGTMQSQNFCKKVNVLEENNVGPKTFSGDEFFSSDMNLVNNFSVNDYEMKPSCNSQADISHNVNAGTTVPKQLPSSPKIKIESTLRHSVDELMLPVASEPNNILDNSSCSDEVMNVDQFVNERFRKITESDMEVTNGSSLNLELSSLDLFQFHTS